MFVLTGLSACYTDVKTPKLSDIPPRPEREIESSTSIKKELDAAVEKNEQRRKDLQGDDK